MRNFTLLPRIVLLALLFPLLWGSCKKEKIKQGDLEVTVYVGGNPAKDAQVYTSPASQSGLTDDFGSVLLRALEEGSYEVFANVAGVGTGKKVVLIEPDKLSSIEIYIIPGVNGGLAPVIENVLPVAPAEFAIGETIQFSATVNDEKTALPALRITWESDKDGILNQDAPNAQGKIGFSTTNLSKNLHAITLTVKDEDDYESKFTFQLSTLAPQTVNLLEPQKQQGKVILNWTTYPGNDFKSYEIWRSDENCSDLNKVFVGTVSDKNTTTFTDALPPFAQQVCYFLRLTNQENISRNSNTRLVSEPGGLVLHFVPFDVHKHPTLPRLYLLDREALKLTVFDYEQMSVVAQLNLPAVINKCDLADNGFGLEFYAPAEDGWVYVYDAENLTLTTSINVGLACSSVATDGNGHLYVGCAPSPWWEQPVRSFSRASGLQLNGPSDNGVFERNVIRRVPGKNELMTISTTVSPTDMEHYKFDLNTGDLTEHTDDLYHGDHPLDPHIFRIDPSGSYAITSAEGAVYTANSTMNYRGFLQRGTLLFSDYAFNEDGSIIYAATSNRKSVQIGRYPQLTRQDELLTRGYPMHVFRDQQKLVLVSKPDPGNLLIGIEVIDL